MTNKAILLMPEIAIMREVLIELMKDREVEVLQQHIDLRAEVERLKAENATYSRSPTYDRMAKELATLRAENERLRGALEKIADSSPFTQRNEIITFVRAALQSKGE